jgi:hypothetical protein
MTDQPSRVFIPQHPSKFNIVTRENQNDGDLSGVLSFGHPIFMLPRGKIKYSKLRRTIRALELAMFDYTNRDYLLVVGDPVVTAAAVLIAARKVGGSINVIRWLRQTNEFKVFPLDTGSRL